MDNGDSFRRGDLRGYVSVTRSRAEAKSIVEECERGFDTLRAVMRQQADRLYVHPSYLNELMRSLSPSLTTPVVSPSRRPQTAAKQVEGIMRQSLSFHVEPAARLDTEAGNETAAARRADKVEQLYVYAWKKFNSGSPTVLTRTNRLQAVCKFVPWWLSYEAFALPKDPKEAAQYRQEWWPFRLQVLNPYTVSFLADDNG